VRQLIVDHCLSGDVCIPFMGETGRCLYGSESVIWRCSHKVVVGDDCEELGCALLYV
jgi:hypothetical protein